MDITVKKNSKWTHEIPADWNALLYVHEGQGYFCEEKKKCGENSAIILKKGKGTTLQVHTEDSDVSFMLVAGKALGEKIVQYGPFVLENESDLEQTFTDYDLGINGFENAKSWKSEIRKLAKKSSVF